MNVDAVVNENDHSFISYGVSITVDEMSLMYLVGTEINYLETLHQTGFTFTNPNVRSTCGCGNSFSA